jgi:hypothetical protein
MSIDFQLTNTIESIDRAGKLSTARSSWLSTKIYAMSRITSSVFAINNEAYTKKLTDSNQSTSIVSSI